MRRLAVKIVLPFALALVVLCAVAAWTLGRSVRQEAERDLRERVASTAQGLARSAELPLLAGDESALTALLAEAKRDPDVVEAFVLDGAGRTVAALSEPASAPSAVRGAALVVEFPVRTVSAAGSETSAFVLDEGASASASTLGTVRLVVSLQRTEARVRRTQAQIAAGGLVLLVLCVGIGWGVVRLVGAPLQALVDATRRIAGGDLSVRVVPTSRDEVGALAEAFNRMAADLEVSRAEVLAERNELERRVQARTAELHRAQETLVQSERLSAVGQLVAGVAHELNNPLTTVLGYAGLLVERTREDTTRAKLTTILQEAQRSRKIVQNLLAFARKQTPERSSADVNEAVARTVALRSYHLRSERIQLEADLQPDVPLTWADFHQIQQVVLNLVVNAEQAIHDSGRGSRITVRTRATRATIRIEIEDDGPGIPPAVRSRIFEPFFTTKDVGRGTGLGLSICYGIVSEHGGTIQVDSEVGKFTRFVLTLPVQEAPAADEAGEAAATRAVAQAPAAAAAPRRRLLVVDDDAAVLRFVEDALEGSDLDVRPVRGGREAIACLARGERFDAILCDVRMPDLDGPAVFRYLSEERPELRDRLVFATGDLANPASQRFLERCGRPVLAKPFEVSALREALSRAALEGTPVTPGRS